MKTKLPAMIAGGLLLATAFFASPPARADKYVYYPAQQVYFSPTRTTYYYMDSGTWRSGEAVPTTIHLGKSVSVDLEGDTPYVYHSTVIKQYPVVAPAPVVPVKVED